MSYILDAVSLIIVCFLAWRCSKKGFVKTAVLFFGFVVSAVIARYLALPIANFIYDSFIAEKVSQTISMKLATSSVIGPMTDLSIKIDSALDSLPEILRNATGFLMGSSEAETAVSSAMVEAGKTLSESIETEVVKPAVISLLQSILFIVLFVILSFLIKKLAFVGGYFNKIPVVGKLNMFLGGVLGTLEGLIIVFLIAVAIHFAMLLLGDKIPITQTDIDSSFVFKFFYEKNPLINIK